MNTTCILSNIINSVGLNAHKVAIQDNDITLTYDQLLKRVRFVSAQLNAQGLKENDKVVLLCEKSSEYIIHFLAVWFSGAVVVPLDPTWPLNRLVYVLDDLSPDLILCSNILSLDPQIKENYPVSLFSELNYSE